MPFCTPEIAEAFRNWLNEYKITSVDQRQTRISALRKAILKAIFNQMQVDRLVELSQKEAMYLADALGIPVRKTLPQRDSLPEFKQKQMAERQARWKTEKSADEIGEYWTVVGAYMPTHTNLLLYQGIMPPVSHEVFEASHNEAHMFLEPTTLLGKLPEVRSRAAQMFQGVSPLDLTIRVQLKAKQT